MKKTKLIAVLVCLTLTVALSLGFSLNASAANYGFFTKESIDPDEYAYSIAVIGDTQSLVDSDVKNAGNADYKPRLEKVYNWLVDNKDSKKIEMVLGLGDIVETWNSAEYPDAFRAEWEHATSEISKLDGNIPYTLVRGNHDTVEGFNTYVGAMDGYLSQFESEDAGFMYEDSYDTSYRRITLGTTDWLIITLDWATTGAELDWAGKIISENKDAQVIITLHSYIFHDMTLDGDGDTQDTAKHNPDWDDSIDPTSPDNDPDLVYNPSGIWERLVSKHENIKFVLSGHVANGNMIHSQVLGDNGNTVTQMLVNPQGIDLDRNYPGGCGMVCMLYFREDGTLASTSEWDGNNVSVEWYSTIKDQYFKDENQFDLDLNLYDGGVPTEKYGVIPAKYADAEKYPFVTFGYDDDTGEYFFHSADSHWTTADSGGACLSLSRFSTKDAEAFILLRRDFNAKEAGDERYKNFGNLSVNLNIDLGGHEFVTNYYVFDANLKKESASNIRIYGAEGSAFVIGGANSLFWLGTNSAEANGSQFNYTFDGIRFAYSDSATASTMLMATFSASGDSAYSSTQNITFNNCTFDLTNAPDKAIKLMALNDSEGASYFVQKTNVKVNGGKIKANGMADITLYTKNANDTVYFGEGKDGALTLTLPESASAPTETLYDEKGNALVFEKVPTLDGKSEYKLTKKEIKQSEIDVWLIGGQSNAAGYANDTPSAALTDKRYTEGFEDVLYYGKADGNAFDSFVPVKIGQGTGTDKVGAEIGIASAVSGSGRMNAVIKLGRGSSYLYPDTGNAVSTTYGTWTSPTYLSANGISTDGNKIGALYTDFLATVTEALRLLESQGYTPVIRGMWWMQGEAEVWREALANEYGELLTALIGDLRSDLSKISGSDLSDMPFVFGLVGVNTAKDSDGNFLYNQPPYINEVVSSQLGVASSVPYAYAVSTDGLERRDQWHFVSDAQQYLGEQFVGKVREADGKFGVSFIGGGASAEGIGAYLEGDTVTVKITVAEGLTLKRVTVKIGNGAENEVTLTNGEYSFTMPPFPVVIKAETHDPSAVKTKYGTIPSDFADASAYPFAVFVGGSFYGAYSDWYTLLNNGTKFMKNADKCATVLLRDDYGTTKNSASPNQLFGINGTLNFDLGGNTITINKKSHLFQFLNKCTAPTETNLNLYNGSIVTSVSYTPFIVNGHAESTADWDVNVKCDGVRFVFAKGSAMTKLLLDTFTAGTTLTNFNATFTGCTFDISEATGAITFFNSKETGGLKSANIEIVGGSIITSSLSNITLYSFAESGDSLVISRDKSGNYPTLSVKSGADLTSEVISDSLGTDYGFTKLRTEGGYDVYALALADLSAIETPFGIIPGTYASEATYPFVVFKDKEFFEGYKTWDAFLSAGSKIITSADAGKNIVMLVRRDYATSENASSSQNWYTFKGNITIELDNHTITIDAKSHLFQLINKATSVYTTGITVNNGTIVTYKNYAPFTINGHASSTADWSVNLVCNGVTFKMHASSTLKNLMSETYTAGTTDTAVNATFNDCVFDLSAVSHAVNIFNVKETSGSVKSANIVVNGGVIKAQSMSTVTVYTLAASGDSFVFGKGTGGKYTTLELPAGSSAPANTYPTVNGNYAYSFSTRVSSVGGVAYMLSPAELSQLNLKTNVTLYSDFVLNAYFPVLTGISSVKVNGISVAFKNLETAEIDGKLYYILPTEVASSEAAEDVTVSITLTYGEDSFSAKWTLGVVKYAEKALATEQTDITCAMLRDMLSYVRASYKYFASVGAVTPEACEIATAKIDAIIGGDYDENNAPKMEESAVLDPEGLSKATVSLGAKISFVFYPTEDAEKYTFTMGGAKLETEVKADGAYIVVTTYAYAVRETVEYTVEGTDITGSYNLKAYYEYMAGEGNGSAELIALVERLFKYSESCEAYRNEVNS